MEDIFIKNIYINKVRHLENIDIPISETERKHLILTGKNGSGKTSVLLEIKNWLNKAEANQLQYFYQHKQNIDILSKEIIKSQKQMDLGRDSEIEADILSFRNGINSSRIQISNYASNVEVDFDGQEIFALYSQGNFILSYFQAQRNLSQNIPQGISKIPTRNVYQLDEKAGINFVQYIVNLKADRSFARDERDETSVNEIDNWFKNFEKSLQGILDDDNLRLEFDRKNYNFNLITEGREVANFNTLSDGYSAIFNIISELIFRMQNREIKSYDIQGIVLIDEIETHLHIDLQKKILPFLTNFFPKIQFIVTTHSPFVLNSVSNAVIFDLEKKLLVEDLSGYSVEGVIEGYFNADKYSEEVKSKLREYEMLSEKDDLTMDEKVRMNRLEIYFEELPKFLAPELQLKFNEIQLAKLVQ